MKNIIELKFSIPGDAIVSSDIKTKLGEKITSVSKRDDVFSISFASDPKKSDEDNIWMMFCDIAAHFPGAVLAS